MLLFHSTVFGAHAFRTKSVNSVENLKAEACALKYFHGFLTFTDGENTCEN